MTGILDFRSKLIGLYQKVDHIVIPALKFLLAFLAYLRLRSLLGFDPRLNSMMVVLILSAIAAVVPSSVTLAMMILYASMQLAQASVIMAGTTLIIAVIIYCFFIRLISNYSATIIAMPLLVGIRLPYVLPISLGLFSNPVSIIPACLGVFVHYFLLGIRTHMVTLEQVKAAEDPFKLYKDVVGSILNNGSMLSMMMASAVVIIVMYLIRNAKMDYSFEISVATGAVSSMLVYIIFMLRTDLEVSLFGVIAGSALSGVLVLIGNFMFRPLYYYGTEKVQFEDDDYYYYVRAVPKIKTVSSTVSERQFITGRKSDEDGDEFEEENKDDY